MEAVIKWIAVILMLWGCSNDHKSDTRDIIIEDVQNLEFNGSGKPNISELLNLASFKYIPLEMNNQGLLSGDNPEEIQYNNGRFIILDKINNPVVVFDEKGNYSATLGTKGKGPDEFLSSIDISVPKGRDSLFMLDYMGRKIVVYDLHKGNQVIKTISIVGDDLNDFPEINGMEKVKDGFLLFGKKNPSLDSHAAIIHMNSKGSVEDITPFPSFTTQNRKANRNGLFQKSPNELILLKNYSDTIWTWNDHVVEAKYTIPFPNDLYKGHKWVPIQLQFQYKSYLENDNLVYITYFINAMQYIYLFDKNEAKGYLINVGEGGIKSRADMPTSELFYMTDSIAYGFFPHSNVLTRYEKVTNYINDHYDFSIPEYLKQKFQDEFDVLKEATRNGNGLIVKYNIN